MAIRPTIRLINANWHDQTVVAFCSARCASHRGRKKRQRGRSPREAVGFPRFDGLIWKIGRVSEERRKKNARGKEVYVYIYVPFVLGVGPREHRRCGRRPAFSPAEFPFAPTRPPPRSFSPRIAGCPRASRPTPSSSASFSSSSRPSAPSAS